MNGDAQKLAAAAKEVTVLDDNLTELLLTLVQVSSAADGICAIVIDAKSNADQLMQSLQRLAKEQKSR